FYRQMYALIAGGHVYVAQPPLFRVRSKKDVYYVQTEEAMKSQLLEKGLADAEFDPRDGRTFKGEEMKRLCQTLASMEEAIIALERRGIGLKVHAERMDVVSGRLPVFHVFVGREERWFVTRAELDAFLESQEQKEGKELAVADVPQLDAPQPDAQ